MNRKLPRRTRRKGQSKQQRITFYDRRIKMLKEEAFTLLENGDHRGIKKLLDAAMLSEKILALKPDQDMQVSYRIPRVIIGEAVTAVEKLLEKDPSYIRDNHDAMTPLLLAIEKADPFYAEWTSWQIVSNIVVSYDLQKRSEQANTFLRYLWETVEPPLFTKMLKTYAAGDFSHGDHLFDMWHYTAMRLFELSERVAKTHFGDRRRIEKAKPPNQRNGIALAALEKLIEQDFPENTEERRIMRAHLFQQAQRELTAVTQSAAPAPSQSEQEVISGGQFIAGTREGERLRDPIAVLRLLRRYKPKGPAN